MSTTKKNRVLIADEMSPRAGELLRACASVEVDDKSGISPADLLKTIGNYNGLLVRSRSKVTAEMIEAGKDLRIIGRAGIGVDNIDVKAASRRGIIVENAPSGNSVTTAEHALCLLLSLARHIPQATASMKNGKWEKTKFSGAELWDKTLGIIGLGNIGRIVADRARGLKLKVIGSDPFISREVATRLGIELVSVDELITRADFITVHTPLTAETKGILGAAAFQKCKPGLLIVNAARGGIVDEEALLQALNSGKVGGAALDVFNVEPTPADHPLVLHPKVICTPHLGASTEEAQEKVAIEVAEQMIAFFDKGEVKNAVNVAALSAEIRTRLSPWLELCSKLGALVGQLASADKKGIDALSVEVIGEAAELGGSPCTNAALVGLLKPFLDVPVNEVNASIIAGDRGLAVTEVVKHKDRDHTSAIALTATVGGKVRFVKGTLYHVGERVEPRLVQLDDFLVEATPSGRLVVVINKNRPGVIGAVGTLLGKRGINVNSLHVGVGRQPGVALALWNVDQEIDSGALTELNALELVDSVQVVELEHIRLPVGVRDLLPRGAARRRSMADALLVLFDRWGYERLVTPMFELADVFERGLGADARAATIRFVEPGTGDVVALRPDITPQIARIAATYPLAEKGPARLCYEGTVSRESRRPGGSRDQLQAGIELIGASGAEADAEVACIAAAALATVGVAEYRLELGHVALVRTVLTAVPADKRVRLEKALGEKDQSTIATLVNGLDQRLMALCRALPTLVGSADSVFDRVKALSVDAAVRQELEAFAQTVERVRKVAGVADLLSVDLSEVRGFHYYTGMRLFGYLAGVGHAVLRGGRYDDLIGQYGAPAGATGFAIDIEAIADAQAKAGLPSPWARRGLLVVSDAGGWMAAQTLAASLRKHGVRVATRLADGLKDAELEAYAGDAGFARVLVMEKSGGRVIGGNNVVAATLGDAQKLVDEVFGGGQCRA